MPGAPPDPAQLDPETFEAEKYREYFPLLQRSYKRAFETLNGPYDSTLVHALDQQVLNESEPVYGGDGEFTVELPADPTERVEGVVADDEEIEALLERYVEEIEAELRIAFGFVEGDSGGENGSDGGEDGGERDDGKP